MSKNILYVPTNRQKKTPEFELLVGPDPSQPDNASGHIPSTFMIRCYGSCLFLGRIYPWDHITMSSGPQHFTSQTMVTFSSVNIWNHQLLRTYRVCILVTSECSHHMFFGKVLCVSVLLLEQRLKGSSSASLKQNLLQGKPDPCFQRALALAQHLMLNTHTFLNFLKCGCMAEGQTAWSSELNSVREGQRSWNVFKTSEQKNVHTLNTY